MNSWMLSSFMQVRIRPVAQSYEQSDKHSCLLQWWKIPDKLNTFSSQEEFATLNSVDIILTSAKIQSKTTWNSTNVHTWNNN
jgi:hypothetical protein